MIIRDTAPALPHLQVRAAAARTGHPPRRRL